MTENRYEVVGQDGFFQHIEDTTLKEDKHEGAIYNIYQVVRRLNEQDKQIRELETRNKRQYEQLKKITDLIFNRNWEALELIVEDWEESNGLLQAEYGNCGDVE